MQQKIPKVVALGISLVQNKLSVILLLSLIGILTNSVCDYIRQNGNCQHNKCV